MMASYKERALGSIGHMAAFSFHETKNYTSGGEGGLLIINDKKFAERAEIIREKGTNRSQFFRGMVDKYQWVDVGSSYLPSELQAAYLWGQLENAQNINDNRLSIWKRYYSWLSPLQNAGRIELAEVPSDCCHNGHMFYIKTADLQERGSLLAHLKAYDISAAFHYVPLHSAKAGKAFGVFIGEDIYTTKDSERLVRLPIWFGLSEEDQCRVVEAVNEFFK
jgi:dTDP-4-amino-4,6-dideoxygalactose transaminase